VIAALQRVADRVGASALALLRSPQPPDEVVLATLLNDLDAIPHDVVLVLDDYHVIEARDVHDGVAFLPAHLPPQIHLVNTLRTHTKNIYAKFGVNNRRAAVRRAAELGVVHTNK
jgi:LuxR family maltose regulon positive regulatory protein